MTEPVQGVVEALVSSVSAPFADPFAPPPAVGGAGIAYVTPPPPSSTVWQDVRRWVQTAGFPTALFSGGLWLVGFFGRELQRGWVVAPVVIVVLALIRMSVTTRHEMKAGDYRANRGRLLVNLTLTVVTWGLSQLIGHAAPTRVSESFQFTAFGVGLMAISTALSSTRRWYTPWPARAAKLLLGAGAVGLFVVLAEPPLLPLLLFVVIAASVVANEMLSEDWITSPLTGRWVVIPVAAGIAAACGAVVAWHPGFGRAAVPLAVAVIVGIAVYLGVRARTVARLGRDGAAWMVHRRVVPVTGLLLLVVCAGSLAATGTSMATALVITIALVLLVGLSSSEGAFLVTPLLLVAALVWAGPSRTEPPIAAATPPVDGAFSLTLGDSYISGEGARRFMDDTNSVTRNKDLTNNCRRANTAWPMRLAGQGLPGIPAHTMVLSCSGAIAAQIRSVPFTKAHSDMLRKASELVLYNRDVDAFNGEANLLPRFALVSIGGNDVFFGEIGQSCVGPGSCVELEDDFMEAVRLIGPFLDATFHDIAAALDYTVPAIAVPYPDPINGDSEAVCSGVFLDAGERAFIGRFLAALNGEIEQAATRAGFSYMDTMATALGDTKNLADEDHRLCDGSNLSGLNFVKIHPQGGTLADVLRPTNWTHNSLHPNEFGHELLAKAAARWFDGHDVTSLRLPIHSDATYAEPGVLSLGDGKPVPDGWLAGQTFELLRLAILPLISGLVGAWLACIALLHNASEKNRSLLSWLHRRIFGGLPDSQEG